MKPPPYNLYEARRIFKREKLGGKKVRRKERSFLTRENAEHSLPRQYRHSEYLCHSPPQTIGTPLCFKWTRVPSFIFHTQMTR